MTDTPSTGPSATIATVAATTRRQRSLSGQSHEGPPRRLGAGLVEVPAVAYRDPAHAVMSHPVLAEHRRFCGRCDAPVGRGGDGVPGPAEGICHFCGTRFSFLPKLRAGERVAGQYDIVGCLAHGGLGWIYLARDRNVADRWVVLKGLLNSDDEAAMSAALAERRFLAEVEHPNIVKIFNFVEHDGSGYIVMEYVGGTSLRERLVARRDDTGAIEPLPAGQAIAYMIEILPALGYLHHGGLLFCDFKPGNVIQTEDSLKLIDLGGVYRIGDDASPIYGTAGYDAPEIGEAGPSIASDLFTVGRTLAVLCTDFRGFQTTFRYALPPQDSVELYQRFDSLYRLLLKATAPDPDDRFQSAEEMRDQLFGVLREIVAAESGTTVTTQSTLFTTDLRAHPDRPDWRLLPVPRVASRDPAAGYLASVTTPDPRGRLDLLGRAPVRTTEVELQTARALVAAGEFDAAERQLAAIEAGDPWEWRVNWYRGVAALADGRPRDAQRAFTRVYLAVPGELAPKLAVAVAAELEGALEEAAGWYEIASRTDPWLTTATFGLARCALARGERSRALAAYERIPDSSRSYTAAQTARIRCLIGGDPDLTALWAADRTLETLEVGAEERARLTAELLLYALRIVEQEDVPDDSRVAGEPMTEHAIRAALERTYRSLSRFATTPEERIRLVDRANRLRPTTWI
jgi:serine/threonine-protein kinase PknG